MNGRWITNFNSMKYSIYFSEYSFWVQWFLEFVSCYDKIAVGVLFLNIKLKNYFLNKIFLWQSNLGRYLNFPHIFFFIQQVWFEILVKNHFLLKYKKRLFLRCSEWGQKQTLFSPLNEHFIYKQKTKQNINSYIKISPYKSGFFINFQWFSINFKCFSINL